MTAEQTAPGGALKETEKGVFSSPLSDLKVQHYGLTFAWLPDPPHARWERITSPAAISTATILPALRRSVPTGTRYGRPTLDRSAPDQLEESAALVDLCMRSRREIVRLRYGVDDLVGSKELAQVRRDVKAGRKMLAEQGVLPWAAYPDGEVPAAWWTAPELGDAVELWCEEAAVFPSAPPAIPSQPILDYIPLTGRFSCS